MSQGLTQPPRSTNLAELLERILDKGVVVAGDIKIKLVEIELLTIQIRLVVCSVERAIEMGMDWWKQDPNLSSLAARPKALAAPAPEKEAELPLSLWPEPAPVATARGTAASEARAVAMEQRVHDLEETLRRLEAKVSAVSTDAEKPA